MDPRFLPHNTHLDLPETFANTDPHLRRLAGLPLIYYSQLLERLPEVPGIYTVTGGRQVGKTTLLKQWMEKLLGSNYLPGSIFFLTGELIDDHHTLIRIIIDLLKESPELSYLLLDEATYISNWDKGVKYLADAGYLDQVTLVITGSDSIIIQEARTRFPGRRGLADVVDYHLDPLSFSQVVRLKKSFLREEFNLLIKSETEQSPGVIKKLFDEFGEYLIHGGFLTAINDMAQYGRILPATFHTYSDWIRGDFLKRGKQEQYLREIVGGIIKRYGSQITWNNLMSDLSINHPQTVADYAGLLASMDAVFIQHAIREDKLVAAPKKAKKLIFTDPFIYHALYCWLYPCMDPFREQVEPLPTQHDLYVKLVEASAIALCRRRFTTFYIKAKGEVDIAYIDSKRFWPVEIKWTGQLRPKELAQVQRYSNSRIWSKSIYSGEIKGVPVEPLPLALFRLDS